MHNDKKQLLAARTWFENEPIDRLPAQVPMLDVGSFTSAADDSQ